MKIEPQNKLGWSNLASMVGRLGRHEKALDICRPALAVSPRNFVEAHLHAVRAARRSAKRIIVGRLPSRWPPSRRKIPARAMKHGLSSKFFANLPSDLRRVIGRVAAKGLGRQAHQSGRGPAVLPSAAGRNSARSPTAAATGQGEGYQRARQRHRHLHR